MTNGHFAIAIKNHAWKEEGKMENVRMATGVGRVCETEGRNRKVALKLRKGKNEM